MNHPLLREVRDRAEFDALLATATNYERMPEFHAGRVRFDLGRMREYIVRLGNPQLACPVVHVTGTKGKGSTAALVARVLTSLGGPTGLHTSPHLHRMEERVMVDFRPIPEASLLGAANRVLDAARIEPALDFPTYFELMTLTAFLHFAASRCAFAVHEVGMGGTLDATNVVAPAATAITNVALEHAAVLGPTVAAIAREKSGIVKPGAPLLTAATGEALPPIVEAAARAGVAMRRLGHDVAITSCEASRSGLVVGVRTWRAEYRGIRPALRGAHQAENVALAIGLIETLRERGLLDCRPEEVVAALEGFSIPCRMETVARGPEVVVDGAHTPESIAAACSAMQAESPGSRLVALFGLARDKDAARAAEPLAGFHRVVATTYGSERQADPQELARLVREAGGDAVAEPDLQIALDRARSFAEKEGRVLVVGSLYLAARVRAALLSPDAPLYPAVAPRT